MEVQGFSTAELPVSWKGGTTDWDCEEANSEVYFLSLLHLNFPLLLSPSPHLLEGCHLQIPVGGPHTFTPSLSLWAKHTKSPFNQIATVSQSLLTVHHLLRMRTPSRAGLALLRPVIYGQK